MIRLERLRDRETETQTHSQRPKWGEWRRLRSGSSGELYWWYMACGRDTLVLSFPSLLLSTPLFSLLLYSSPLSAPILVSQLAFAFSLSGPTIDVLMQCNPCLLFPLADTSNPPLLLPLLYSLTLASLSQFCASLALKFSSIARKYQKAMQTK